MVFRALSVTALLAFCAALPIRAAQLDLPEEESSLYLETDRDLSELLAKAAEHATAGRWRDAVDAYQQAIEFSLPNGQQPVDALPGSDAVSVPVQRIAGLALAALPRQALAIYREAHDATAKRDLEAARARRDLSALTRVARRYPASSWADDALAAAGSIAFSRGDYVAALRAWRSLDACPDPDVPLLSIRARMCLSLQALGLTSEAAALAKALRQQHGRETLAYGGRTATVDRFLDTPFAPPLSPPLRDWPMLGGDGSHSRAALPLAGVGERIMMYQLPGAHPGESDRAAFSRRGVALPSPSHAVLHGSRLLVGHDAFLAAIDPTTGTPLWMYPDAGEPTPAIATAEAVHAAACEGDRVFARLADALLAFDAGTGRLLWSRPFLPPQPPVEDEDEKKLGSKTVVLLTSPVVAGGRVYAGLALLGDEARSRVVALDAGTGSILWDTFVCSRTIPAFLGLGASAAPPAVAGDTVYHCSNLGAVAAVSLSTGTLRWVHRYPSFPAALRHDLVERHRRWDNGAPLVAAGRLLVAPQDSSLLLALHAADGSLAWASPRDGASRLAASDARRVFVAGPGHVRALDLATGKLLWSVDLADPLAGSPVLAGRLLVPTTRHLLSLAPDTGDATVERVWLDGESPGNLAAALGALLVTGPDRVQVFENEAATRRRLAERMAQAPQDAEPHYRLAWQEAARGRYAQAVERFQAALRLAKGDPPAERAARWGLLDALMALGRQGDPDALALAARTASTGHEIASALLAGARLREQRAEHAEAVDAFQQILLRAPAARLSLDALNVSAGALAASEIARLIRAHGRAVYANVEARAGKLLADAKDDAAHAALVRLYPNSASAEEALLVLTRRPNAETRAADLAALAALLPPAPASPARANVLKTLAQWRGATRLADAPLTRQWNTSTCVSQRKAELLDVTDTPAGLLYFALARRSYRGGLGYAGIECRAADTGSLLWERDLAGWNRLATTSGGRLVLATVDRVLALDPTSGVEVWSHALFDGGAGLPPTLPGPLDDPDLPGRGAPLGHTEALRVVALAATADTVFAGQMKGTLRAFDSATGDLVGTVQLDTKALLANGLVADGGALWACVEDTPAVFEVDMKAQTSRRAFTIRGFDTRITARPTHDADRGRLYIEIADKTVQALDLRNRRELWDARIPFAINGFLVSEDGTRCFVVPYSYVGEAELLLLDADTGKVVRRRSLQTGSLAHAALAAGALYFTEKDTDRNVVLHALDPASLAQRWQSAPLPLFASSPLAVGDGFVALCGRQRLESVAVVIDAETGKVAADVKLDDSPSVTPGTAGRLLCLGTERGILAFAPTNREGLDRRVAELTQRRDRGDPTALASLANALYQRGDEEQAIEILADALADESLDDTAYAALKDQLDALRESLAARRPALLLSTRFTSPPNIDGAINEGWRADRAAPLVGPRHVDPVQGYPTAMTRSASPSDLSGTLYTGWDDDYFYFAVDVKDDIHRTYTSRADSWVGDGLIIAIDCENDGGYGYRFDGSDILLTLALTRKDENQEDMDEDDEPSGEYRVRRKDDNSGTVYEIAIPWGYLGLTPRPGLRFGFNVTVADDDGDEATKTLTWTPGMVLDRSRSLLIRGFLPTYFGDVELAGERPGPLPVAPPGKPARRDTNLRIRRIREQRRP